MCVSVCVCVKDREKERERDTHASVEPITHAICVREGACERENVRLCEREGER